MARGSSPTAEQVQRAKLTLAKSSLSVKKVKKAKKLTKKAEQAETAAVKAAAKLAEKGGKENKKAKDKSEREISVPYVLTHFCVCCSLTNKYRWTKASFHHLSDKLLGFIEENDTYKVAFGFDKGDVGSVPTGGKKTIEHHRAIARKLFLTPSETGWTVDDLVPLGIVVKNRVSR
jgi:hypothetical protein